MIDERIPVWIGRAWHPPCPAAPDGIDEPHPDRTVRSLEEPHVLASDIAAVVRRVLAEEAHPTSSEVALIVGDVLDMVLASYEEQFGHRPIEAGRLRLVAKLWAERWREPVSVAADHPQAAPTGDECEKCAVGSYDDGMHAGKLLMATEMEKVVKRELGDESDPADRPRDVPEVKVGRMAVPVVDYFLDKREHDRLKRIEEAARRVEDEYDLPDLPECVEQLFEVLRAK